MSPGKCFVRDPIQKRGKNTKRTLLEAGLRIISKSGYYKINSKDIAKEAGVSIGSFYSYFKDKKELFLELVREYKSDSTCLSGCDQISIDKNQTTDPRVIIEKFIYDKITITQSYPKEFLRELQYIKIREEEIRSLYEEYKKVEIDYFEKTLSLLKPHLSVEDPSTTARMIFNIYEEIVVSIIEIKDPINREKLTGEYCKLLCSYLIAQ